MTTEVRRANAHRILKKGANEPELNIMDYSTSMLKALNYYNVNHDNKEKKDWFVDHFGKKLNLSNVPDYQFRVAGTLCRIMDNGNQLSDKHLMTLDKEYDLIVELSKKEKIVVEETKPVVSIQEKMDAKVSEFLGEFAGIVDEFVTTGTHAKVDLLIQSMNIRGPMVNKVIDRVQGTMDELKATLKGDDKFLIEGYSNFKKTELKKLLAIYEGLVTSLGQAKVLAPKKPRAIKAKPPVVVAKNVKYKRHDDELGLKSVEAHKLVNCTEAWFYNVKTKKLSCYEAAAGQLITVKGTSLVNFDTEKSVMKTIRKPNELAKLLGSGVRSYRKFFKELKTTESNGNGRLNEETIIMAVY